jgi:hypothetical protein
MGLMRNLRNLLAGAGALAIALPFTTGCTRLVVQSDPPNAVVLWSATGVEPFRPWPPNSWELRTTAGKTIVHDEESGETGTLTPLDVTGVFGDTVFVTVELEGYRRPLPQMAQLYTWRNEKLSFTLEELPERYSERMMAQGFLYYRGEWVNAEEAGLEVFNGVVMPKLEAHRLRQVAAGLVEYKGEWMTREQALEAEEIDMLALGKVRLKGRWVTVTEAEIEKEIDRRVAEISAGKIYPDLTAPRIIERTSLVMAEVQLTNSSGQRVEFLFSGPVSKSILILPYQSAGFRAEERINFPAGLYDIVAIPTGLDAAGRDLVEMLGTSRNVDTVALQRAPQWTEWPIAPGTRYSFNFGGSEAELREGLDAFELPEFEIRVQTPALDIPESRAPQRPQRGQGMPGGAPGGARPSGGGRPQ